MTQGCSWGGPTPPRSIPQLVTFSPTLFGGRKVSSPTSAHQPERSSAKPMVLMHVDGLRSTTALAYSIHLLEAQFSSALFGKTVNFSKWAHWVCWKPTYSTSTIRGK